MKIVIFMLFAVALTDGDVKMKSDNDLRENSMMLPPTTAMTANMNAYMDLIMIQTGPWILRSGWVPMDLPDYTETIEHRVLLITYTGELQLTRGELTRLVSVARSGNAIISYQNNHLRIAMAANIRQISFRYDYLSDIMGLQQTGWLEGSTNQLVIACDFFIDFSDFMIYMQDFRVVTLGSISINLRGNPLVDWLSNLIITTVTALFRGPITDFISMRLKELLQETIDEMNNRNRVAMLSSGHGNIEQILKNLLGFEGFEKPFM